MILHRRGHTQKLHRCRTTNTVYHELEGGWSSLETGSVPVRGGGVCHVRYKYADTRDRSVFAHDSYMFL